MILKGSNKFKVFYLDYLREIWSFTIFFLFVMKCKSL